MRNLKFVPTTELYSLWAFSKEMLSFWSNADENIEKYYKQISDEIMDEINGRVDALFHELSHLLE